MGRAKRYLTREGVTERHSYTAIEVELRSEEPIGHAWFAVDDGSPITEWSNGPDLELTAWGEHRLALLEKAAAEDTGPTLEEAYADLGISHRPRLPGERGKMYPRTLVDAASGEPIATLDASAGWDFVRWCAGQEVARG